ncbi:MAG: helix-turn-helix transcriptional regulator [Treponema sp.]|nr:helix-turn-helix transcriptional regulator [Treponema sp.]MDY4130405.1 helix-turn-helix transcriptional regulator [Treponema sp.]
MGKIKTILGDNIRTLRIEKGWTQVYLADRLQITAPFLAQIESGKRGTSLELVESVAELFGIPIASLFLEQITNYAELKSYVRDVELKVAEKQLQEIISENITKTFERLREK